MFISDCSLPAARVYCWWFLLLLFYFSYLAFLSPVGVCVDASLICIPSSRGYHDRGWCAFWSYDVCIGSFSPYSLIHGAYQFVGDASLWICWRLSNASVATRINSCFSFDLSGPSIRVFSKLVWCVGLMGQSTAATHILTLGIMACEWFLYEGLKCIAPHKS